MTDVHQEEEAKATPPTGTESDTDLEQAISELFPEDDSADKKDEFLAQVNKIEGRNYKTIEDYAKTVKERQKAFSEQGRKKEEAKPQTGSFDKRDEKLLKLENPKSQYVMEELKQVAKERGIDILEAWDNMTWIRREADARAEEAEAKDQNGKKVSKPSSKISGKGGSVELSEADRALLSRRPGLLEKYVNKPK